jgi:hypothetical protein
MSGPVQGAEECARRDHRLAGAEGASTNAVRDERSDAAFVAIPLGDDPRNEVRGQRVYLEVRRRASDFVNEAEHVCDGKAAQARGVRTGIAAGPGQRREQAVEGSVLTEKEEFVFAAEVVIQVAR